MPSYLLITIAGIIYMKESYPIMCHMLDDQCIPPKSLQTLLHNTDLDSVYH